MTARDPRLEETAFPSDSHRSVGPDGGNKWPYSPGMTLRDYFAGQALASLPWPERLTDTQHLTLMAHVAYAAADAMIEQRKKL